MNILEQSKSQQLRPSSRKIHTEYSTKTSAKKTQTKPGHPAKIEAVIEDKVKKQRHNNNLNPHFQAFIQLDSNKTSLLLDCPNKDISSN